MAVPGGIQYVLTLARTGTYKDKSRDMRQPTSVMAGWTSGTGILDFSGTLANLIIQRGRWTVQARPVSGPGIDDLPIYRKVVRNRRAAEALVEEWARQLETGEPVTEQLAG